MPSKLTPVRVWACPMGAWHEVVSEAKPPRCAEHDSNYADMGYRVGEAAANYSWYTSLETALRDRRCK